MILGQVDVEALLRVLRQQRQTTRIRSHARAWTRRSPCPFPGSPAVPASTPSCSDPGARGTRNGAHRRSRRSRSGGIERRDLRWIRRGSRSRNRRSPGARGRGGQRGDRRLLVAVGAKSGRSIAGGWGGMAAEARSVVCARSADPGGRPASRAIRTPALDVSFHARFALRNVSVADDLRERTAFAGGRSTLAAGAVDGVPGREAARPTEQRARSGRTRSVTVRRSG